MAPSFDGAVSGLLCVEGNHGIFDGNDYYGGGGAVVEEGNSDATWRDWIGGIGRRRSRVFSAGDLPAMPLMQSDECLGVMIEKEGQHMPNADYVKRLKNGDLDLTARKQTIDWIAKVQAHFGFGPLCLYLSINYLDRFLSAYKLPKGKAWMMQLVGVACLSLAAKMEETEVPLSLDLQVGEAKYVFEARTIQRMELLILSKLGWRMQAITPFSFLDNFFNRIMMNNGETPSTSLITLSIQLILATIKGIDLLEYRSSEIAAAVVSIAVVGEETTTVEPQQQHPSILLLSQYVKKEKVLKCIELIKDLSALGNDGGEVPGSPDGVLEVCLSYRSDGTVTPMLPTAADADDSSAAVVSCASATLATSSHSSHSPRHNEATKRRKLSSP
ncbi:CYCD4-1 [Linum perenne]